VVTDLGKLTYYLEMEFTESSKGSEEMQHIFWRDSI